MASLKERIAAVKAWVRGKVNYWRVRRLSFDHLLRAIRRYQQQSGDRLAGAVTYFAFLSFFPLLALSYAVLGFVVATSGTTRQALEQAIAERLPGIAGQLNLEAIARARETAGLIGLLGLLYAGLGALDALRQALREMSMAVTPAPSFFAGKLRDLVSIIMIGVTMIVSVLVAGFATTATDKVMHFVFGGGSAVATWVWRAAGVAAAVGADWLLFLILLGWVARPTQPFRVIAKGALIGAIGFGLLKQLATLLLGHTLGNPIYGTFAVIVGLLIWINFSARLVLYVAAWTATAGYCPPPVPSPIPASGAQPDDGPLPGRACDPSHPPEPDARRRPARPPEPSPRHRPSHPPEQGPRRRPGDPASAPDA
ncbi:YihY/virulence factor BrkB family protein [Nonomuraea phyllanthi]|uniref:YihY/virulence factor BrkB family protein n=1 Tax=Nonomuraea phyllanthi TaxID=2219224 RepID=UPI001292EB57|nr:YihY/virulence factor BrkB family protein [Nonomuraea phyllanthi]QFY06238.1 YihY/virulence factor BrkB family protein [Nonomuraea phyllanthi]